jgi:hypothetical protein
LGWDGGIFRVEELRKIKDFPFSQNETWPMTARSVQVLTSVAIKNEIAEAALIGFRYWVPGRAPSSSHAPILQGSALPHLLLLCRIVEHLKILDSWAPTAVASVSLGAVKR